MRRNILGIVLVMTICILIVGCVGQKSGRFSSSGVTTGPAVQIIDYPAQLRPSADAVHSSLAKIPVGTRLKVLDSTSVRTGGVRKWNVTWYKVRYRGKTGWVSEHTCKRIY